MHLWDRILPLIHLNPSDRRSLLAPWLRLNLLDQTDLSFRLNRWDRKNQLNRLNLLNRSDRIPQLRRFHQSDLFLRWLLLYRSLPLLLLVHFLLKHRLNRSDLFLPDYLLFLFRL